MLKFYLKRSHGKITIEVQNITSGYDRIFFIEIVAFVLRTITQHCPVHRSDADRHFKNNFQRLKFESEPEKLLSKSLRGPGPALRIRARFWQFYKLICEISTVNLRRPDIMAAWNEGRGRGEGRTCASIDIIVLTEFPKKDFADFSLDVIRIFTSNCDGQQ